MMSGRERVCGYDVFLINCPISISLNLFAAFSVFIVPTTLKSMEVLTQKIKWHKPSYKNPECKPSSQDVKMYTVKD